MSLSRGSLKLILVMKSGVASIFRCQAELQKFGYAKSLSEKASEEESQPIETKLDASNGWLYKGQPVRLVSPRRIFSAQSFRASLIHWCWLVVVDDGGRARYGLDTAGKRQMWRRFGTEKLLSMRVCCAFCFARVFCRWDPIKQVEEHRRLRFGPRRIGIPRR